MFKKVGQPTIFLRILPLPILFLLALSAIIFLRPFPAAADSAANSVFFRDLQGHWAGSHITRLASLDAIKGYPDYTFKPGQQISRLETLVLLMRSTGFEVEAKQLTRAGSSSGHPAAGAGGASSATSRVPWGQEYLDLAVDKGFLQFDGANCYDFNAPATRLEAALLLAHMLYLQPPLPASGKKVDGFIIDRAFTDEAQVPPSDRTCLRALAAAGIMSGYPDGSFRPQNYLTRAEAAVIISGLVDQDWIKISEGKRYLGLISGINSARGVRELELITPGQVQKFKVDQDVYCCEDGGELSLEQAVGRRAEIILGKSKQVLWVNLSQPRETSLDTETIRGSVKLVALGKENLLVLSDLNCQDRLLPVSWEAVLYKKDALQSFASLKPGVFLDVQISGGHVKKATMLEVKSISSQIERFDGRRLYLKGKASANKPGWFNYYDRARVVDREGFSRGEVQVGDRVQITYLDPYPGEIDDEIPLEIRVQ
ncbi:MAG: S-layer homology domain-containing protein [Peptococcaceae bacterium]|nr:S-layer homology domain-containing protein [Peptococcaceae bacterium]